MKNKIRLALCLIIAGCLAFSGCAGKDGDTANKPQGSLSDGLGEGTSDTNKEDSSKNKDDGKESRFKKTGKAPILLRHKGSKNEHNNAGKLAINHHYSYFTLDSSFASSHKELAESLLGIRDEILSDEEEKLKTETDSIEENELYSYEENWDTYLRRADNNILSLVTEYVAVGEFDGQYYTEYTSHNFYTENGEEIKLTDVVKDEEAFFDLLAGRLNEYFYYAKKNIYFIDADTDDKKIKEDVKGYLDSGSCAWTLDPYGITFFLDAYTGLPEGVSATVFFSDDKDGSIFDKDFLNDARDEWIIQSPMYIGTYVDLNNDGKTVYFNAHTTTDLHEGEGTEYYYISGLYIGVDGAYNTFKTSMPEGTSDYDVYLSHKNGKTVAFECHDEYDTGFITSYLLGKKVEEADAFRGVFEWSEDDYENGTDIVLPHYVPVDADNIRVLKEEDNDARDMTPDILSIDEDGKMELDSGDFDHYVRIEDDGSIPVNVGSKLSPFYGVWVGSFKERQSAAELADKLEEKGFKSTYLFSVEWDNLSKEPYYCVTAGMCESEEEADKLLEETAKAGYADAYVKYTGDRISHRIYYVVYGEESLDISDDEVIINNVQFEELSGGKSGEASFTVNKDTVFDESCDMKGFGNLKKGDSPLEWFNENRKLLDEDPDKYMERGPALKGVFDASITGNHVDAFYGSYWMD